MEITHEGKLYRVVDDPPKSRDLVLTDNYGVWEFREKPDFLPYWCNPHTCKKMVLIWKCNNCKEHDIKNQSDVDKRFCKQCHGNNMISMTCV